MTLTLGDAETRSGSRGLFVRTSAYGLNQQDGRHIGRIPEPGYDAIIADVPCSSSATTRKNVKVWEKWRPLDGRSLFSLQVNIAESGARGLRPGGKMIYSTCSIDPVENEAVVAELLRNCPWMELVEINEEILPGLIMHDGLSAWDVIDDEGKPVEINETLPKLPGLKLTHIDPQKRQMIDENVDEGNENYIAEQLKLTKRLYHMDNDTGGFFVALLRHKPKQHRKVKPRSTFRKENWYKTLVGSHVLSMLKRVAVTQ